MFSAINTTDRNATELDSIKTAYPSINELPIIQKNHDDIFFFAFNQ